jgi:hypothetical protein
MDQLKYPGALETATWDKQKAALAKLKPTPIRAELDKLSRCHDIVDWAVFRDDKLERAEQAEQRLVDLDREAKKTMKALAQQADNVAKFASKADGEFKKDKQTPKEVLALIAAVEKAAKLLQNDIDVFIEAAKADIAAVLAKLQAKEKKVPAATGGKPNETKAYKFVRAKALECIRKIKKPQPGAKPWRFMVVKGTPTVTVCMLQTVPGGTQEKFLRSLIPAEKAQCFKDPKGEVIWEKNAITLVSDRLPSGLAKKMQEWLKKLTKLNAKVRIRKRTGEVEESEDGEDLSDEMLKVDPAEAAAKAQAGKDWMKRLAGLAPDIKKATAGSMPIEFKADIKELVDSITKAGNSQAFEDADDDLHALEALLEEGDAPAPGAASASVSAPAPAPASADAPASGGLSVKQLAAARLEWGQQREHAVAEIKRLAQTLVREFQHETEQQAGVRKAVQQFQNLIGMLKTDLEQQLDAALGENDPAQRARLAATAKQTLGRVRDLLDQDPVMRALDGNELIADMKVVEPMKKSLRAVEAALG